MQDRIEKVVELAAPIERVWQAIRDYKEFGEWFRVKLQGPFVVGDTSRGQITYPGYEHLHWEAQVKAIEPGRLLSFEWCPYGGDPNVDYSKEPKTRVEFRLEKISTGTRLFISESGFASLPDEPRCIDAFRTNGEGWEEQTRHITEYLGIL